MSLPDFSSKWRSAAGKAGRGSLTKPGSTDTSEGTAARMVTLGGIKLLFGLEWVPAGTDQSVDDFVQSERKRGRRSYVECPIADLVGLSDTVVGAGVHSAALYLGENVSKGGSELFALDLTQAMGQASAGVVALVDSVPVPGFDRICAPQDVLALTQEFQSLQPSNTVRMVGDVTGIDGMEHLNLSSTFVQKSEAARIRPIPNPRNRAVWVLGLLLVAAACWALYAWYEADQERKKREAEQQTVDPNIAYESAIAAELRSATAPGSTALRAWNALLAKLPLEHRGWRLLSVGCVPSSCRLTWSRTHGSFDDFLAQPPSQVDPKTVRLLALDSLKESRIEADLPLLEASVPASALDREKLPEKQAAFVGLGSYLQDLQLLGATDAKLTEPAITGQSGADIQQIKKPVLKGGYSIKVPLAAFNDMTLPDYCVPKELGIEFPVNATGKFDSVFFKIRGDYYAKGKQY